MTKQRSRHQSNQRSRIASVEVCSLQNKTKQNQTDAATSCCLPCGEQSALSHTVPSTPLVRHMPVSLVWESMATYRFFSIFSPLVLV